MGPVSCCGKFVASPEKATETSSNPRGRCVENPERNHISVAILFVTPLENLRRVTHISFNILFFSCVFQSCPAWRPWRGNRASDDVETVESRAITRDDRVGGGDEEQRQVASRA